MTNRRQFIKGAVSVGALTKLDYSEHWYRNPIVDEDITTIGSTWIGGEPREPGGQIAFALDVARPGDRIHIYSMGGDSPNIETWEWGDD